MMMDQPTKQRFAFANRDINITAEACSTKETGFFKDAAMRFVKNKASVIAFIVLLIVIAFALFAPAANDYAFDETHPSMVNMPPKIPALARFGIADGSYVLQNRRADMLDDPNEYPEGCILEVFNEREIKGVKMVDVKVDYYIYIGAEDEVFWFGSDYLGRDTWTRLWRGTRVSLIIAFAAVLAEAFIGVVYGAIAGYFGGMVDMVMMRIAEIIKSLPRVVTATIFVMFLGTNMLSIILALVINSWVGTAIMIRSQFYRLKGQEYVLAAKTFGIGNKSIIFRHILPNAIGPVITMSMMQVPSAIFAESFLAYIGLGLQAPEPSIGVLLASGQDVLLRYPEQTFFPAIVISLLMISFNLIVNGLRDALDPTQRGA